MATDGTLKIGTILDETGLRKGLAGLGSFAKKGFSAMGSAASAFAKTATAAIGAVSAGIAAAGTAAIAVGQEFETSFAKASTLFGDVNVDTDNLKKKLLEVSDATGVAAGELNESLYSALSAGIPVTEDMSEATAFLESSAKLAKAGFTDMDTALSATAKTLNAYGLDVSEADRINKILIQTQNKGITTVGELGASLAQVTPTAAAFGVSFENVGAALANMTAAGTPTAQATTQLNSLIAELGKSGTTGAKSLEKAAKGTKYAGMSFKEMMDAGVPLNEVLDMIQQSADKSGLSMVDMFSSIEAGKAGLALSGENSEKFASNLEAMGTSADVVTDAYDKVSNTLANKVTKIQNSAKNLGISVFNGIQEPLKGLADMGLGYMDDLSAAFTEGGLDGLIEAGAGIVSEIALGIADQLPSLIDTATGFILTFVDGIAQNLPQLMTAGGQIISSLASGIVSLAGQLIPIGASIIQNLAQGLISSMPTLVSKANTAITSFGSALKTALPQIINLGVQVITSLVSGIAQVLPTLVPVAVDAVLTLADSLISNIGTLVDAGIELLMGLADGVINAIPMLIEQAPTIITNLCTAIVDNLPKIVAAGVEILIKLAAGIIQAIPQLVASLPQIFEALVAAFKAFNVIEIGLNIIKGIKDGIINSAGLLVDAVKDVAEQALEGLKSFLGIHSPSRVMRDEVGKNISLGIAEGITANAKYAEKSAEEVADAVVQAAKKRLDNTKVYNSLTLADEVAFWDSARKQVREGTQARIDADNEYLKAKKSLNNKMTDLEQDYADKVKKINKDLTESIKDLQDAYKDELTSRTKDISSSMSLFDEFTATTELSTDDLLNNLKSQVKGLREWSNNLRDLEDRGVSGDMLEELRGLGTDAAGEIALMTEMSDSELDEYIRLWKQKQRLARKEAEAELEPLLSSTNRQIQKLRSDAAVELDKYKKEYVNAMSEIGVEIQQPLQQIQDALIGTISQAVQAAAGTLSGEASSPENIKKFAELAKQILGASGSLPSDFTSLGQNTIAGMIQGLNSKSGELYAAMTRIVNETVQAAQEAAQIHSPSRIMRDLIGRNMIAGIGVGFELEAGGLNDKARGVVNGAIATLQKGSVKDFIAEMQAQSLRTTVGVDSTANIRYMSDHGTGDTGTGGKIVLEKGSIEVPVNIEGRAVAKVSAPYVDVELGQMKGKKDRG